MASEGMAAAMERAEEGLAKLAGKTSERVVLRGVQVIVLDDLLDDDARKFVLDRASSLQAPREAWLAEAVAPGSFDAAVEAHAGRSGEEGNKPGRYRAVKKAAWLEKGPRVIEPPIA